jgi:hypothetical protein
MAAPGRPRTVSPTRTAVESERRVPTSDPDPRATGDLPPTGDAPSGGDLPPTGEPPSGGEPPRGGEPRPGTAPRTRTVGLRPRHVRRVGSEHVGRRVSLRRWVDDPRRGPVQADVVGRLVAWTDRDLLVVVDRAGAGSRVHAADIVSSRVVPEHPRLPAEAQDAGSRDRPLTEHVVRVLLRDPERGVLLARPDADQGRWRAPGTSPGRRQEPADAARALVAELVDDAEVRVGPPVLRRATLHHDQGLWWRTEEVWHLVDRPAAGDDAAHDGGDAASAWWTARRLLEEAPPVDPEDLAARLGAWSHGGPPQEPDELPPGG